MKIDSRKVCYELQLILHRSGRMNEEGEILTGGSPQPDLCFPLEEEPLAAFIHTSFNLSPEQRTFLETEFAARHIVENLFAVRLTAEQIVLAGQLDFVGLINRERVLIMAGSDPAVLRARLSEGNPESEAVFDEIMDKGELIDPVSIWGPLSSIRGFDNVGLYGADIARYHKELSRGDIIKTMAVERAQQLNLLFPKHTAAGRLVVQQALAEGDPQFADRVLAMVQKQLPSFGLIEENLRAREEQANREVEDEKQLRQLELDHPHLIAGNVVIIPEAGDMEAVNATIAEHADSTIAVVKDANLETAGNELCRQFGFVDLVFLHVPSPLFEKLLLDLEKRQINKAVAVTEEVLATSLLEATRAERRGVPTEQVASAMAVSLKSGLLACASVEGQGYDDDVALDIGKSIARRAFYRSLENGRQHSKQ